MPESDKPTLVEAYTHLVGKYVPDPENVPAIGIIDQNSALLHKECGELGLNLRDPEMLRAFIKAHMIVTAWVMEHIMETCGRPQDCGISALSHFEAATGELGIVLKEMSKHV